MFQNSKLFGESHHAGETNAVALVDALLHNAISGGVSDIHLEPTAQGLRVRFRVDGVLYDQVPIPLEVSSRVISRLKVLSHIDIAERRIPQDGKFGFNTREKQVDLRVSTFPSTLGEKVVVRILDRSSQAIKLDQLGFAPQTLSQFKELIVRPHGFFLVTGPTGAGKTTTLYAALSLLHTPDKNTVTLEDPVEYDLKGITQGQINPQAGFTFAKGIRAVLRQDPDILMVGEIRDRETAAIAIESSLTGHVVLSTLHTNDAPSAIVRLMDMGIAPFLINASLTGVLAQRLARTICAECRTECEPDAHQKKLMHTFSIESGPLYIGAGCHACDNLGYKGRTGIFELLVMTNSLRAMAVENPDVDGLRGQAIDDGMQTLAQDGAAKVKAGIITLEELARVVA